MVFIFDHKREFSQKMRIPVCTTQAQLASAAIKGGVICFDYHDEARQTGTDRIIQFRLFCDWVYGLSQIIRGRKILVFDEGQEVAGPQHDPVELIQCLDDGRSLKLDVKWIAQSMNGLHTDVRAQITEAYFFRHEDRNGLSYITEKGINADLIDSLRPGQFVWKNFRSGQTARGGKAFQVKSEGIPDGATIV